MVKSIFEEGKVKFFWISNDYNRYLRSIDHRIYESQKASAQRPSISVGLRLNGHDYVIPLTSENNPSWNNQLTLKIKDESDPSLPVISCLKINNMHPVLASELTYIDFESQSEDYKRLLYKEFDYIKKHLLVVIQKAEKAYFRMGRSNYVHKEICVDFLKVEQEYANYSNVTTTT